MPIKSNSRLPGRKYFLATPKSSVTKSVNYSEEEEIVEVEYNHGDVYHYLTIPKQIWDEYEEIILSGGSSGEFLNYVIKKFPCVKIG